nr:MAG TPA: hypothetical protein [Caudoviricetes sp.]
MLCTSIEIPLIIEPRFYSATDALPENSIVRSSSG